MTTVPGAEMPENNSTRHKSSVALILIDVINHFEFPDGDKILKNALPIAGRLAKLKQRCRRAGIPAIYVNDNFGQWRSDAKSLVSSCLASDCAGRPFVEPLRPDEAKRGDQDAEDVASEALHVPIELDRFDVARLTKLHQKRAR